MNLNRITTGHDKSITAFRPRFSALSIKVLDVPGLPKGLNREPSADPSPQSQSFPAYMDRFFAWRRSVVEKSKRSKPEEPGFRSLSTLSNSKSTRRDVLTAAAFGTPSPHGRIVFMSLTAQVHPSRYRDGDGDVVLKIARPGETVRRIWTPSDLSSRELADLTAAFREQLPASRNSRNGVVYPDQPCLAEIASECLSGAQSLPQTEKAFRDRVGHMVRLNQDVRHALAALPDEDYDYLAETLELPNNDITSMLNRLSKLAKRRLRLPELTGASN